MARQTALRWWAKFTYRQQLDILTRYGGVLQLSAFEINHPNAVSNTTIERIYSLIAK